MKQFVLRLLAITEVEEKKSEMATAVVIR